MRLEKEREYYLPFQYKDPVIGTEETSFLLKSDKYNIHFLHPYTYQFYKQRGDLELLRNFNRFSSIYELFGMTGNIEVFDKEVLFCRNFAISRVRGSITDEIGLDIPEAFLHIDLPKKFQHFIDIVFELFDLYKLFYFRQKSTKYEWIIYVAQKLSSLPVSQSIKNTLFKVICDLTVTPREFKVVSLILPFQSIKFNERSCIELINTIF